jgi:N-acyl-L-homoserine lactone synthetase
MHQKYKSLRAVFCTEDQNPDVVDQLFQFRKELFVDNMHWDLPVQQGRERDQFDTEATVHCALFRNGKIVAGFRGIRTDKPYVAQTIFPWLATFTPYPRRRDTWEISRLGVLSSESGLNTGRTLYSLMFYLAHRYGAKTLVALGELKQERLLTLLGVRTRRYGPPQAHAMGEGHRPIWIVAGATPIGDQRGERFEQLLNCMNNVEIDDETLVLRSDRLSA